MLAAAFCEVGHGPVGGEGVALHLDQRDGPIREAAVGVEDGILAVLPALVGQARVLPALVVDQAIAVGVAVVIHPFDRSQQVRPQAVDEFQVAGAVGVGARQGHEQRRGVDPAVVAAEGQLAQGGHLAPAGLVHDLAGLAVAELRGFGRLGRGQVAEHAAGQGGVDPQHLPGGDDGVAAELGREPGDAGIGIGAGRQVRDQERQVGPGLLHPLVEQPARGLDPGPVPALGAHGEAGPGGAGAEAVPARCLGGESSLVFANLQEQVDGALGRDAEQEFGAVGAEPGGRLGEDDGAGAGDAVQPVITEHHRTACGLGWVHEASAAALAAAHLEHVVEIGAELEGQGGDGLALAVVGAADPLMQPAGPQEALALDVDHTLRRHRRAGGRELQVGAIGGEEDVVLGDRGAQQRR